jgi:hypothetical protein
MGPRCSTSSSRSAVGEASRSRAERELNLPVRSPRQGMLESAGRLSTAGSGALRLSAVRSIAARLLLGTLSTERLPDLCLIRAFREGNGGAGEDLAQYWADWCS